MYDKKCISVTSHALYPPPSRTPSPLERDVLYGRPLFVPSATKWLASGIDDDNDGGGGGGS